MTAVVVGAGLSGLMAARELSKDMDINVRILSTGAGASPYVHGLNMPLSKGDSIDCFRLDTLKNGYFLNQPELVDILCEESLKLLSVLEELGIELDKDGDRYSLLKPLGSTYPRVACCGNHTGALIMKKLREELSCRPNVMFQGNTRVLRILTEKRRPEGLLVFDENRAEFYCIEANGIILTGGGFSGIYPFSTNTADIGGDVIAMAYEAGASLTDMEFIQFEPSVALYPATVAGKGMITTMFYDGAVLRNKSGERFMLNVSDNAERVNKDIMAKAIYQEVKKGNGTEHGGVYFDATGVGRQKLLEVYPSYVARYESAGIDICREMFEIAPAPHTSLGGVAINEFCETSVAGIYAAGEAAGGIHGANRIGGNAGLETLVFGSRAGVSARKYLKKLSDLREGEPVLYRFKEHENRDLTVHHAATEEVLDKIREEMEQQLANSLNVIRNGKAMSKSAEKLKQQLEEVRTVKARDNLTKYKALRLENDITCAYLLALSANNRKGSVGCHIREDEELEDSKYNIFIEKGDSGPYIHRMYQKGDTVNEKN